MKIKEIPILAMLSAILYVVQVALAFLPNIELVSLLIILYTLIYKKKTLYIIYTFVLLEGFTYGFTLWWFNYLYIWTILYLIVRICHSNRGLIFWSIVCGAFGLGFGALCSIPYFFMGGLPSAFAYWVNGIPFDITHCIGNTIITLVLFKPLYHLLSLTNNRYSRYIES